MYDLERPDHAYLLGFLMGDGSLPRGKGLKGALSIELHARDAGHLEKLSGLIPWSTISRRTRTTNFSNGEYESATLSCSRLEVREALKAVGLPEGRKATTLGLPPVPFSLRDFARGLCDADGSLGMTGLDKPYVSFVTASPAIADWWCNEVIGHVGAKRTWKPNSRDGVANVMITMEGAVAMSGWLYQDGDLALDRKAESAHALRSWVRPSSMRREYTQKRWTAEEDAFLLGSTASQAEMAASLGRTIRSVNIRKCRLKAALLNGDAYMRDLR